ncbi:MAG: hypothetical protein ACOVK1_10615, partial [Planktothrix agardhii]
MFSRRKKVILYFPPIGSAFFLPFSILNSDIATAKAVRTPDGSCNPDSEVFSPQAPRARGVWGGCSGVPCYI